MFRRTTLFFLVALSLAVLAGCSRTNKHVTNPLANLGSKQPDKVLFDRAMDQMKHNKFDQARMLLQTLINTYPDSEYIARAKLAVGDSWYAEGGSAALAQAENEYKDFQTFFPNMTAEASEAQMKIANIHYRQMEKPDRDFTHAKRAEEEYRTMILQYPDSPLIPQAKERLREVQEVLAEREYRIGRFYYLRESWPAAIARLQSLVDTYPLYSGADDALYMLGNIYEKEIDAVRASRFDETKKGELIKDYADKAAVQYARIITRYPVGDRAEDAKKRLEDLHRPVPTPTPEAIAQNKQEEASREELGRFSKFMTNLHKRPDVSLTARVGEPTLVDPKQTSAPEVIKENNATVLAIATGNSGGNKVSVETVKTGTPPPNQPVPRSDNPGGNQPDNSGIDQLQPAASTDAQPSSTANPDPAGTQAPPTPPPQVNEAQAGGSTPAASAAPSAKTEQKNDKQSSSSKKKKKKGLGKLNPF
jgi:outer membrane protein assembly factor BamD